MTELFDNDRVYVLGDPELVLIGPREKLAQWRHRGIGPAYFKLGRKILYSGADLNAWASAQRCVPDGNALNSSPTSKSRRTRGGPEGERR